jgi:lantibiotic modifying enzyme
MLLSRLQIPIDINGELTRRLETDYQKIVAYALALEPKTDKGIGMYTGVTGDLLLLANHFLLTKDSTTLEKIYALLDYGVSYIENQPHLNPTYSSGAAGFGWIVNHLISKQIIDPESNEILDVLDQFLAEAMAYFLSVNNIDLLNGAMGIGLYFLQRNNLAKVKSVIEHLNATKIINGEEFLWKINKFNPEGKIYFDLSLAHGMAGVLHFLSRCAQVNQLKSECGLLIEGINHFFEHNLQEMNKVGSFYPNKIDVKEYENAINRPGKSRLAWCYGDLGILSARLGDSLQRSDAELTQKVTKQLRTTSTRRNYADTSVQDAGFCHGCAGNAYLYSQLFKRTNEPLFGDAASYWLAQSLTYNQEPEAENAKYHFLVGKPELQQYEFLDNFLEGLIGVGLVYQSVLYPETDDWNNSVMLF